MSEDPTKVSKNDLRNSQFGGGFIDAETVNADRIGGDIYNVVLNEQPALTRQERHNRQALLTKVKNFWIKGVLEKSLYNQVLIELGLEERPDTVANPWNVVLETGDESPQPLPEGTKVIDIFDRVGEGRTLLILGEPGSGKTTTLLELTRDLIARAEEDINLLIPVVFNLSSWANKRQKIADWLVEELGTKYDVPKAIREPLVSKQQLLPLLDGLDEVKAEYRDDCITALNQFKQDYGAELIVCSRIKDYKALSNRLNFQSAVYIRSLTLEQICHYLDSIDAKLTGLRALIKEDVVLQELAQLPLMLNIMMLAYRGVAVEDLPKTEVVEERRKQLFDDYILKMFKRPNRSKGKHIYSEYQTKHWLIWLAQRMSQQSESIFLIERMQPFLLVKYPQIRIYNFSIVFIFILMFFLIFLIGGYLQQKLIYLMISGICVGSIFGWLVMSKSPRINTVENITFSKMKFKSNFMNNIIWGLSIGLISWLIEREMAKGLLSGLITWLAIGVIPAFVSSEIEEKTDTNQGIKISALNSCVGAVIGGLASGLIFGLIQGLIIGITSAIFLGLFSGLISGGIACIQHFILRLILYFNNYIPWNYARFLDYAADRIFLQKVGGGYIFMHRMLMEHFAQMELER